MSQAVNTTYARALRNKALQPVYILEIEGVPTRFSDGPITSPTGSVPEKWMNNLQGAGAQITVDEGKSSLGAVTFSLLDKDDKITRMAFQYQLGNRAVTIKSGFQGMPEEKFVTVVTGRILDYTLAQDNINWNFQVVNYLKDEKQDVFKAFNKLTAPVTAVDVTVNVASTALFPTATAGVLYVKIEDEVISYTGTTPTSFTGCVRGQLGTVAAAHAVDVETTNLVVLQGNPLTLALQILTSTGLGTNGPYDVLPTCAGLGIDQANIDVTKFESERDRWLSAVNFRFEEFDKVEGKKFLEEQIYTFCNAYPITDKQGRISIKVYQPPLPSTIAATITDDDLIGPPRFQGNVLERYFFNEVDIQYDYDFKTGLYLSRALYEDSTSQVTFGDVRTKAVQSRGFRTDVTGVNRIDNWATRILKRFGIPSPVLKVKAFFNQSLLEPGDIVPLTSAFVPDLSRGIRGITNQLMEVVQVDPNFREATEEFLLLNTGYSYGRKYAAISPSAQAPTFFPVWTLASATQRLYAFISRKVNATYGVMSDGSDGYYITP